MSTSEVQTIIQDVFSVAEQDLDADEIIGKLFSAYIIDYRKYQSIQKKETTIDKNRALLEHLYETADKEMLTQFCTILKDSTRPKHMKLECLICKKLESVQSSSTSESKRYYAHITFLLSLYTWYILILVSYCMPPLVIKRMRKKKMSKCYCATQFDTWSCIASTSMPFSSCLTFHM